MLRSPPLVTLGQCCAVTLPALLRDCSLCLIFMTSTLLIRWIVLACTLAASAGAETAALSTLCLDRFCIGQSIQDSRFSEVEWIVPKDARTDACTGVGCRPEIASRGYSSEDQKQLANAVNLIYEPGHYSIFTKRNLESLRRYHYECNLSPRGYTAGERRFMGAYLSLPSHHLTVIGLRLIGGELRVYRIARQFPYQNQGELIALARRLQQEYKQNLLLYDGISANAYSEVIGQKKNGWFGRSSSFNPSDLSDNLAELVLIDPRTRSLLKPSSMPESGEIAPLRIQLVPQCSRPVPLQ